jgi:hypothetical protein
MANTVIGYSGIKGSLQLVSNKWAAVGKWGVSISAEAGELPAFGQKDMIYSQQGVRKSSFTLSGECPSTDANMVTGLLNKFSSTNTAIQSSTSILNFIISTVAGEKKKLFGYPVFTSLSIDDDVGGVATFSAGGVLSGGVNVSTT